MGAYMTERQPTSHDRCVALQGEKDMTQDSCATTGPPLSAWGQEMLVDLGGEGTVSARQRALVEVADRTRSYIEAIDTWIAEHGALVNSRTRAVYPVLRERQQLAEALVRILVILGLERRQVTGPDLSAYLRTRYPESAGSSPAEASNARGDSVPNGRRT
jgi:hypothetical protein